MKARKVNEGTWALPQTREERIQKGLPWILKIEKIKKDLYPVFGDDQLFDCFDNAIKRIHELIGAESIKESLSIHLPPRQFFEWWDEIQDKYPNEDWEFIVSTLANDEASNDDQLIKHFISNGVNRNVAQDTVEHRSGFLSYGLDIQL